MLTEGSLLCGTTRGTDWGDVLRATAAGAESPPLPSLPAPARETAESREREGLGVHRAERMMRDGLGEIYEEIILYDLDTAGL